MPREKIYTSIIKHILPMDRQQIGHWVKIFIKKNNNCAVPMCNVQFILETGNPVSFASPYGYYWFFFFFVCGGGDIIWLCAWPLS